MQVSPAGFHITLGIFFRLWCLLEEECHQVDLDLVNCTAPKPTDRDGFVKYSSLVKELIQQEERRNDLRQYTVSLQYALTNLAIQLPSADGHPQFQALERKLYLPTINWRIFKCWDE